MGNIKTQFLNHPNYHQLQHRAETFAMIVEHLENNPGWIIETGTARTKDNWSGDGQSTLIWNWLRANCPKIPGAISIDIDAEAVKTAKAQCPGVQFLVGDSVRGLSYLARHSNEIGKASLLYLDSFDWSPTLNFESALHHLAEIATVWASLPSGCLIVVDDRHNDIAGKHWLVEQFMRKLGIPPVFCAYQIGWIKP